MESIGQTGRRLSFRDANVKTKPSIVISYLTKARTYLVHYVIEPFSTCLHLNFILV